MFTLILLDLENTYNLSRCSQSRLKQSTTKILITSLKMQRTSLTLIIGLFKNAKVGNTLECSTAFSEKTKQNKLKPSDWRSIPVVCTLVVKQTRYRLINLFPELCRFIPFLWSRFHDLFNYWFYSRLHVYSWYSTSGNSELEQSQWTWGYTDLKRTAAL